MGDMTSAQRTNLFRFRALKNISAPLLSITLTDLSGSTQAAAADVYRSTHVEGRGNFRPSFGEGNYTLYFCMDVRSEDTSVIDHSIVRGVQTYLNENSITIPDGSILSVSMLTGDDVGEKDGSAVAMRFDPLEAGGEILVRVGLSFIDPVQACFNAAEEIPDFNFEDVQTSAVSQFDALLNRIRVDTTGISDDTLTLFYSSVLPIKDPSNRSSTAPSSPPKTTPAKIPCGKRVSQRTIHSTASGIPSASRIPSTTSSCPTSKPKPSAA